MQYFLMAAFCWMLVEGIYLYLFVVKVYNITDKIGRYHGFCWGKNNNLCHVSNKKVISNFKESFIARRFGVVMTPIIKSKLRITKQ